jgi:hypothetical protein
MVAAVPVVPAVAVSRLPVRPPRHRARLRCPGRRHPLRRRPLPRPPRRPGRRARHPLRQLRRRPARAPAPCPVGGPVPGPARLVPRGPAGLLSSLPTYRHPRRPRPPRWQLPPCRNRFASSRSSSNRRGRPLPRRRVASPPTRVAAVSPARWYRRSGSPPSPVRVLPGPATTRSVSVAVALRPRQRHPVAPGPAATGRSGLVATGRLPARAVIVRHPVAAAIAVPGPAPAACRPGPTRA